MFVQHVYTEGFRMNRPTLLTLHVVIVHKMSDWRRRVDNWTSTDPVCCWLSWGRWVRLCAAEESSVTCRQMRSFDWRDRRGLIS